MKPHPAVAAWLDGQISAPVALARLALEGLSPSAIEALLPPCSDLATFFSARRGDIDTLARMLRSGAVTHNETDRARVDAIADMFDRAVALSPEASVAAYSLGSPDILEQATHEIVEWLRANALVRDGDDILDFGCGFGRMSMALAPHAASVIGLDISSGMIAEAERRFAAPNLGFVQGDGAGVLRPSRFDLILAVDSLPYLVQAGIARDSVAAFHVALRRHGRLVILNLSYRALGEDLEDCRRWANDFGFTLDLCGTRPFRLWDGAAFVLTRLA